MEKRKFKLSDKDLQSLYEACKPVPYMIIGNVEPSSPQENANRKWQELGEKYGFKWETVEPTGNGDNYFLAEPK